MMFMMTTCEMKPQQGNYGVGYGHLYCQEQEVYDYYFWYWIFALFWISQFILACGELTLAGCVTSWYRTKGNPGAGAFFRSMGRTAFYHLGTVALGSLIIAIVQLARAVLEYFNQKTKNENQTAMGTFIIKCCRCCLWCLEKCLKFINRNAYIETALYGMAFCEAACAAFKIILNNILTVA